jgi:hypothetical protein
MPFLLHMAREEEVPELLAMLLCISGAIAGGLSPLAPTGITGARLMKEIGLNSYVPVYLAATATFFAQGLLIFLFFGGLSLSKRPAKPTEVMVLTGSQVLTVTAIFAIITAVLGYKIDIGLSAFTASTVLLLCGAADQDKAIAGIEWSTLLLLSGASILFYVISATGGVTLVERHMAGSGFETSLLAGMMSFFASSSAVVMPTLIPRVPGIMGGMTAEGFISSPLFLTAAITIGTHAAAYSPVSTMGAIAVTLSSDKTDSQKLFARLFSVALFMCMLTSFCFLLGFYDVLTTFG